MESPSTLTTPQHNPPAGNTGQQAAHPTPLLTVFQKLINDPIFHKALYLKTPSPQKMPKSAKNSKTSSDGSASTVLPTAFTNAIDTVNKIKGKFANWKLALKKRLQDFTTKNITPTDDLESFTELNLITYFLLHGKGEWFKQKEGEVDTGSDKWLQIVEKVKVKVNRDGSSTGLTHNEVIIYVLVNSFSISGLDSVFDGGYLAAKIKNLDVLRMDANVLITGASALANGEVSAVADTMSNDDVEDSPVPDSEESDHEDEERIARDTVADNDAAADDLALPAALAAPAAQALAAQAPALISTLPAQELLRTMTNPELSALLRAQGKAYTGNRFVLLERLGVLPREGKQTGRARQQTDRYGDFEKK